MEKETPEIIEAKARAISPEIAKLIEGQTLAVGMTALSYAVFEYIEAIDGLPRNGMSFRELIDYFYFGLRTAYEVKEASQDIKPRKTKGVRH